MAEMADSLPHLDPRRPPGRRSALGVAALALVLLSGCERIAAEVATRQGAPAASSATRLTRADVERELARRLPHLVLSFPEADSTEPPAPYRMLRFTYEAAGPRRPGVRGNGHGLALWRSRDFLPLWYLVKPGDHPPHTLFWTDANRDGRVDLYVLAGVGDVRSTFVYVDRGARAAFTDSAFALAYTNTSGYASLVDLDADGTPEIIDSRHRGGSLASLPGCADQEVPRRLHGPVAREYRRIAGEFDDANYKFGMTEDELETTEARAEHALQALRLLHPVKIVTVHGARSVDLTPEFPDHLRWRLTILGEIRKDLSGKKQRRCRNSVDALIKHIKRDVARARRGPWTPGTAPPRAVRSD